MTPQQFVRVLQEHEAWLGKGRGGVRANLARQNLSGFSLEGARLRGAKMSGADLSRALLVRPDLSHPDLFGDIGRASCRERVCQSGQFSVVAVSLKQNIRVEPT